MLMDPEAPYLREIDVLRVVIDIVRGHVDVLWQKQYELAFTWQLLFDALDRLEADGYEDMDGARAVVRDVLAKAHAHYLRDAEFHRARTGELGNRAANVSALLGNLG
jgi:hypothetical protein